MTLFIFWRCQHEVSKCYMCSGFFRKLPKTTKSWPKSRLLLWFY